MLELYRYLHPTDPKLALTSEIEQLWQQICSSPHLQYFVADVAGALVSTCTLTIIPNLTRGPRPYGVIENVVTIRTSGGRASAQRFCDLRWIRRGVSVVTR